MKKYLDNITKYFVHIYDVTFDMQNNKRKVCQIIEVET